MRFQIIDGFRGFFLFNMMVVHFNNYLNGRLPKLNHHFFGFVEDAQGFVFLSGLVVGLVYGRVLLKTTADQMGRAVRKRMGVIFRHHAFICVMITAIAVGFHAYGREAPILAPFGETPFFFGVLSLFLLDGAFTISILPMYFLFMVMTPMALRAMARGHYAGVIAVSIAVWVFAQTGLLPMVLRAAARGVGLGGPDYVHQISFNPFAWQILYFGGLVPGMLLAQGRLDMARFRDERWRPVFAVALAAMGGFALLSMLYKINALSWIVATPSLEVGLLRPQFGVLRLASFGTDLVVVVWLLVAGVASASLLWRSLGGGLWRLFTWRPLVFLGQHSLHVYTFHIVVLYLFFCFVDYRGLPRVAKELLPFAAGLSLYLPAWWHARQIRRQKQGGAAAAAA